MVGRAIEDIKALGAPKIDDKTSLGRAAEGKISLTGTIEAAALLRARADDGNKSLGRAFETIAPKFTPSTDAGAGALALGAGGNSDEGSAGAIASEDGGAACACACG